MSPVVVDVAVVGAGTLGGLLLDCLEGDGRWRCTAFHDEGRAGGSMRGVPILGFGADALRPGTRALLAIGDPGLRRAMVGRLAPRGLDWQTFVDRRSMVGAETRLGRGTLVLPFAMLSSDVALGAFCVVSAYSRAGDGSRIGAFSALLSGAMVGDSIVGEECLLGLGSACLAGAVLEDRVTVAPMTVVRRPVPAGSMVAGSPARVFRRRGARESISAGPISTG